MTIQENIPLAPLTTLQVGGVARYFAELKREDDVRDAVQFAKARNLPLFVLGGGSNLVIADSGWPGLVLKIAIGGIAAQKYRTPPAMACFQRGRGRQLGRLCRPGGHPELRRHRVPERHSRQRRRHARTKRRRLWATGLRHHRIGARARLASSRFERRSHRGTAQSRCGFRYRASIFNGAERGRYIIVRVNYRLKRGGAPSLRYADLEKHFAGRKTPPALAEVRDAVRQYGEAKAC